VRWVRPDVPIRFEAHFDDRVVRCFSDRASDSYSIFEAALRDRATAECVVCGENRLTYANLADQVERVATGLAQRGVGPADRVAVLLGNRIEFVVSILAILRLGAIAVPVGIRLQADELRYILANSGVKLVIHEPEMAPLLPSTDDLPSLQHRVACGIAHGSEPFADLLVEKQAPLRVVANEEDTAIGRASCRERVLLGV
jgi:acyl-coenzyme A synthetase/AMP-(fatty) acid ligase